MTTPSLPKPGTDNDRLLIALQDAYPHVVWSPNTRLELTANSRATNLRELGWDVKSESEPAPTHPKGRRYGYRLRTPRQSWPARPYPPTFVEASGQVAVAS
jgi:hypothetical protein